jgi:hypothetical protein
MSLFNVEIRILKFRPDPVPDSTPFSILKVLQKYDFFSVEYCKRLFVTTFQANNFLNRFPNLEDFKLGWEPETNLEQDLFLFHRSDPDHHRSKCGSATLIN